VIIYIIPEGVYQLKNPNNLCLVIYTMACVLEFHVENRSPQVCNLFVKVFGRCLIQCRGFLAE